MFKTYMYSIYHWILDVETFFEKLSISCTRSYMTSIWTNFILNKLKKSWPQKHNYVVPRAFTDTVKKLHVALAAVIHYKPKLQKM